MIELAGFLDSGKKIRPGEGGLFGFAGGDECGIAEDQGIMARGANRCEAETPGAGA
jgi:hypothetical protein